MQEENRTPRNNKWSKQERLFSKKDIETLFRTGKAFSVPCIRVVQRKVPRPHDEWTPIRLGIVVPKKRVRKAYQRNQIKRWIKEAWRLNKWSAYDLVPEDEQWHLFFIFVGCRKFSFDRATQSVKQIIQNWETQKTNNETIDTGHK